MSKDSAHNVIKKRKPKKAVKGAAKRKKPLRRRPKGNSGVTQTQLSFWNEHYKWGDYHKIEADTGLSRPTIKDAFNGIATSDVSEKITNYYLKKVQRESK